MYGFDSEIFNLGSDKEITLKEAACLVKKVAQSYGYNPEIVHLEPRVEAKYAYAEHTKAKELLGFDDKTDLEETIKQMFAWALTQPKRVVKYLSYETEKNIYGYWKQFAWGRFMNIKEYIEESIKIKYTILNDDELCSRVEKTADCIINAYKNHKKVLIAGNGGSAADSQHMATELVGRFYKSRSSLAEIALTTDSSILTAISNDCGFNEVFSRQIEALGTEGDIFIAISIFHNKLLQIFQQTFSDTASHSS